jgi:hypothetical protein
VTKDVGNAQGYVPLCFVGYCLVLQRGRSRPAWSSTFERSPQEIRPVLAASNLDRVLPNPSVMLTPCHGLNPLLSPKPDRSKVADTPRRGRQSVYLLATAASALRMASPADLAEPIDPNVSTLTSQFEGFQ